MPAAEYGSLPFLEQIQHFDEKVRLPTRAWTDIWEGMHARAFVVAGAAKEGLLADMQAAVGKAIHRGTTLQEFRRDFDKIVAQHGWAYNGGRNWRTRVIYETNLRTSYQAGRFAQMQRVSKTRPYWRYRHNDAVDHPRPDHQAWDGLVLRHDDPWWSTHYPPNGWGCKCYVETLSERDIKRLGKSGTDQAPSIEKESVTVGVRGPRPRTVEVPKGIDPGFGYSVGEAAWGRALSDDAMEKWQALKGDAWESLTPGDYLDYERTETLRKHKAPKLLGQRARSIGQLETAIEGVIGGTEKIFKPGGLPVLVNAASLARHIDPVRSEYLAWLPDLLNDPEEVWLSFERHKGSGNVVLRARVIKLFDQGKKPGQLLVANVVKGMFEGWTMIPTRPGYLNKQRKGNLIYGRD